MRRKASAGVASAAVTHTQLAVEDELGWLFRAQPTEDYGIDAHAEVVDGEDVRGRLLALQIKGGTSWFGEPGDGGWWFRPDAGHVRYWTSHSLPVVVVLYHTETGRCHWQMVSPKTLVRTPGGGWKLLVPRAHVLDGTARAELQEAAEGDLDALRIREQLIRPIRRRLPPARRTIVLGGLAAITSGAVPAALVLSRAGRSGAAPVLTPVTVNAYRVIVGHGSEVYRVAFSPHGGTLASSGADGSIRLRDTAT
jgi:WD40 repeat protein